MKPFRAVFEGVNKTPKRTIKDFNNNGQFLYNLEDFATNKICD